MRTVAVIVVMLFSFFLGFTLKIWIDDPPYTYQLQGEVIPGVPSIEYNIETETRC